MSQYAAIGQTLLEEGLKPTFQAMMIREFLLDGKIVRVIQCVGTIVPVESKSHTVDGVTMHSNLYGVKKLIQRIVTGTNINIYSSAHCLRGSYALCSHSLRASFYPFCNFRIENARHSISICIHLPSHGMLSAGQRCYFIIKYSL